MTLFETATDERQGSKLYPVKMYLFKVSGLLLVLLFFASCDVESIFGTESEDAGYFRLDGGTVSSKDAGDEVGLDSGISNPMAEACPWPPTPPSCVKPAIDTPFFSLPKQEITPSINSMIHCADNYIRAALYQTSWESVVEAFAKRLSEDQDLVVELVIDDDQCPKENGLLMCPWSKLATHPRVTIIDDSRSRLMHHKFLIVDGQEVWVGSANMTTESFCNDSNDAIVINDEVVVAGFEAEFDKMFNQKKFGPSTDFSPIVSGPYTVYFSPVSPLSQPSPWFTAILDAIESAQSSVDFMIFAFTRTEVSDALADAHRRGVKVRGLVSNIYANDTPARELFDAGVGLRKGRIHNKMMIIDGQQVITGSANWSRNAWQNNETSLWINNEGIASRYVSEFERLFDLSTVVMP